MTPRFSALEDGPGFPVASTGVVIADPAQCLSHMRYAGIKVEITPAQCQPLDREAVTDGFRDSFFAMSVCFLLAMLAMIAVVRVRHPPVRKGA